MKRAIIPKRGALSEFDYSQIEPRLFAYFAAKALGDPTIADWYREGRDVYREIAAKAYGKPAADITEDERQHGKVWFLMSLYGAGPKKVAAELEIPYGEAKDFYFAFHDGLPQIKRLSSPRPQSEKAMRFWTPGHIERTLANRRSRENPRGYLTTPWGRHLHPPKFGEHKMLNSLIQGSAADMMKAAILRAHRWQREFGALGGIESRMNGTIHDSLMFDGPVHELTVLNEAVPALMTDEPWLTEVVPIEVDHEVALENWAEKVPYEEWKEAHALHEGRVPARP